MTQRNTEEQAAWEAEPCVITFHFYEGHGESITVIGTNADRLNVHLTLAETLSGVAQPASVGDDLISMVGVRHVEFRTPESSEE